MSISTRVTMCAWHAHITWPLLLYHNTSKRLGQISDTYACKAVFLGRGGMESMWSFPEGTLLSEQGNHLNYCLQDNLGEREKKVTTENCLGLASSLKYVNDTEGISVIHNLQKHLKGIYTNKREIQKLTVPPDNLECLEGSESITYLSMHFKKKHLTLGGKTVLSCRMCVYAVHRAQWRTADTS